MNKKRKSISQSTRFEVFKRDDFTCQCCGAKAPDVVLEVDHIDPVSHGGSNNILNLVTSCFECNRGKSNKKLDDQAVLAKQRASLEVINERRNQIEMMARWSRELLDLADAEVDIVVEFIEDVSDGTVTDIGRRNISKWLKRYSLEIIIESADDSYTQYEDQEHAFNMIPRICFYKANPEKKISNDAFYSRGILRNRLGEIDETRALHLILRAANSLSYDEINRRLFTISSWSEFENCIAEIVGGK